MKFIYIFLGLILFVALIVIFFQNTGVATNASATAIFFRPVRTTDTLIIRCTLLGFGTGMFLTLGIKAVADNTFDNSDGFGNI